jgi:hypothetical protein
MILATKIKVIMKKNRLFLLVGCSLLFACHTLKPINLNDKLSVKVPVQTRQITVSEVPYGIKDNRERLAFGHMDSLYVTDNIVIGFRKQVVTKANESNRTTLEVLKSQLMDVFGKSNNYNLASASIQTFGTNRFLIFDYSKGNIGYYYFYTDFAKNINNMDGIIRYKIFNNLLKQTVIKQ